MLDQTDYYHGAAVIRLLEDQRCNAVRKRNNLGYVVNGENFIFLKYTTKVRTPWGFTFDQEDIERGFRMLKEYKRVVLGLICGGDGICALDWTEVEKLLDRKPGRISAGRKHNQSYAVWGTAGELKGKISLRRWPQLLFESNNGS